MDFGLDRVEFLLRVHCIECFSE